MRACRASSSPGCRAGSRSARLTRPVIRPHCVAHRLVLEHSSVDTARDGPASYGDGGRHMHGPRLVPDHRHRRRERRDAGIPMVWARVQGGLHGVVLPHARAGRAHHRRAARRGGRLSGGMARHAHPTLPCARAAQHEDGPDLQTQTGGGRAAQEALRPAHQGA